VTRSLEGGDGVRARREIRTPTHRERTARGARLRLPKPRRRHAARAVPASQLRHAHTPRRGPSGLLVQIRTQWRRNRLDAELSAGADPRASAELSERAAQLRSEPVRTRLANTLVDPLLARRPLRIGSRPRGASLERNLDELVPLIERLCDGRPIDVRGAAMTACLVNDREGAPLPKGRPPPRAPHRPHRARCRRIPRRADLIAPRPGRGRALSRLGCGDAPARIR
jgi:hypothetical protein